MTTPPQLRRGIAAIYVVAAVHVAALILISLHVDVIRGALAAAHPGFDAGRLAASTRSQVLSSVIPHVVLALLLSWRAWRLRSGRPGARIVVTVLLALQLLAHATLPTVLKMLPGYAPWVIAVQAFSLVFELAALWLLWVPGQVRAYFGGPLRRGRRPGRRRPAVDLSRTSAADPSRTSAADPSRTSAADPSRTSAADPSRTSAAGPELSPSTDADCR